MLEFTPEKAFDGKRLINHVIRIVEVLTMSFCDNMCYVEPDCVSINVHKQVSGHGGYKCELNNVTHERHEHDLEKKDDYFYHAAEVGVASLANTHFKYDSFVSPRAIELSTAYACVVNITGSFSTGIFSNYKIFDIQKAFEILNLMAIGLPSLMFFFSTLLLFNTYTFHFMYMYSKPFTIIRRSGETKLNTI